MTEHSITPKDQRKIFFQKILSITRRDIELRAFPSRRRIFTRNLNIIEKFIKENKVDNLYFGVYTRKGGGTKEHVKEIYCYFADVDFKEYQGGEAEAWERLNAFINNTGLKPSFIIHSGYGLHVYWFLNCIIEPSEKVEATLRGIAKHLGADISACELARILRVTGTFNYKYNDRKPVSIIEHNDISYDPEAFNQFEDKETYKNNPLRELFKGVPDGQRNVSLTRLIGSLVNDDLSYEECLEFAYQWNERNNPPETDLREIERTVKSIFEKHHRELSNCRYKTEPSKHETIKLIRVIGISDFLSLELPPRENIFAPWLPTQGLAMVYGPRGVGKTHFAMGVAVAVASGGRFLKWEASKPFGVLYLDGEMPAVVVQERFSNIIVSSEKEPIATLNIVTPDLQEFGMPDLSTLQGQAAVDPYLDGISLVIVDNISTLCRVGRENEGESWLPVQEWGLRLRSKHISVLFVHHAGKGGFQRGTSKREDVLDTTISLKRPGDYMPDEGARFEVHFEKARNIHGDDVKAFETKLITVNGIQQWTLKMLEESLTERIANLLNDGIPQNEIAELLGVAKGTVSKHKRKAQSQELLRNNG